MKHRIRTADGGTKEFDHYARARAIKNMCTECMGWDEHPRDCSANLCPLFPFRGKVLSTRVGQSEPEKGHESEPESVATVNWALSSYKPAREPIQDDLGLVSGT